jgi:hypothetical protein
MGIQANFDLVFKKSFNIFLLKKLLSVFEYPHPPPHPLTPISVPMEGIRGK